MTTEPDPDLMLLYVAGAADPEESVRAEQLLSSASPDAQAAYAEALSLFHAVPLGLTAVLPPAAVGDALMKRVMADASAAAAPTMSFGSTSVAAGVANDGRGATHASTPSTDYASRFRWPVYVTSGLAACLAVALTLSVWNNSKLSDQNARMSTTLAGLSAQNERMSTTLVGSQNVLRSPHLTLASMQTGDGTSKSFGRVLFCPVTRQYQVTVFNLKPLPPGKAYELWLITPDQRKVPAGLFTVDGQGTATIIAHPRQPVDVAANAAVTDEPAAGSDSPTGSIHLVGALPAQ
ncbi:MAG TPA: anti-sigma factor [Tepidisphaeraceae bacterium]